MQSTKSANHRVQNGLTSVSNISLVYRTTIAVFPTPPFPIKTSLRTVSWPRKGQSTVGCITHVLTYAVHQNRVLIRITSTIGPYLIADISNRNKVPFGHDSDLFLPTFNITQQSRNLDFKTFQKYYGSSRRCKLWFWRFD